MAEQLSFDLPTRAALGRGDFFVAPSNTLALALVDSTAQWPGGRLLLVGPKASGKTHLAHVWAAQSDARLVPAKDLTPEKIPSLSTQPLAVEDAEKVAGRPEAQTALFHLYNLMAAEGYPLLMTAKSAPAHWGLTLADLLSRLSSVQLAVLEEPDDALLAALLLKHFADRQLIPAPDLIPYLTKRIERSAAAAKSIVAQLDQAALSEGRKLTRSFAVKVLDKETPPGA